MHSYRFIFVLIIPRCFFALDQAEDRGVKRSGYTDALRFASDSAGEKIDFGGRPVTDVVKHGGRMIGLSADSIHFPRIIVQANAGGLSYSLALINQCVQQMAEVGELLFLGKMRGVGQARSGQKRYSPTN